MLVTFSTEVQFHTYDSADFVTDEVGRLHFVIRGVQEVILHRFCLDSQHEVTSGFHCLVADGSSPHLDCIDGQVVLGLSLIHI